MALLSMALWHGRLLASDGTAMTQLLPSHHERDGVAVSSPSDSQEVRTTA